MPLPERLGKYSIVEVLGKGAMGVVYKAFDPHIRRTVALKVIRKEIIDDDQSATLIARFKNEAQAAGRLTHPGIVAVYEYGEDEAVAYIAMEYVQGKGLREYFQRGTRFGLGDVVSIMTQLLDGLGYAHEQGVIHRDIKPANIIIMGNGKLKVGVDIPSPDEIRAMTEHFTFTTPGTYKDLLLSDLTFTIQSGEMVALVGRSGGGKTTLVDVLTGLLRPTMGSVLVAGLPLMGATLHAWRRVLAYVPQEPMLFEDTLRNNLLWANPYRSDPEIWEALRRVCATDVVGLLPEGLDSRIGERGQGLSGGEKQRMCLARALLRRPKILVLDEATSAVDLVGEQQMLTNLRELTPGMTIVAISHRLSSLQNVDRIMVLQDGRIVEEGRWAELASRDGFLRTMMLRDDCTSGAHVGPVNPW
jgi:ABC-type multidrug transport system fused ATPase/permease subunit